ncbi:ADP-ribosylation factor-like protein 13B isoform X1 [Mytilus edulis]|uniref:ADP-ribosylation factor-like protein 13B isoform X1 n=1 Tax=Mytilus edulis TaxID=6550 RepID=UPI0039EE24D5
MISLMGKCFSCLKRKTQPRREVTLAILGLDNAGKTTATKALLGETHHDTAPTVGFTSESLTLDHYEIKIFDLGGGKNIRRIWKEYFVEVYGVIFVVDSSTPERLEEAKNVLKGLLEDEKVAGKPILLLANKQDHQNAMDEVDICDQLGLEDLVNANKCPCRIETCSALKGTGKKMDNNIKVGLKWMCATLEHNWRVYQPRVENDMEVEAAKKRKELAEKKERVRKIREEREKKEEEERKRLGIEKPVSDDEDQLDGDPFKRVDVNSLNEKEKRMKEEKRKKKELELKMLGRDTNDNNTVNNDLDESEGEIRSSRSLKYLGLRNGLSSNENHMKNGNLNTLSSENKLPYDSEQDSDLDITSKKSRRATPRLPPLQKPLGTKFTPDDQPAGKKKRKKKKLKALQEKIEENEDMGESFQPSKHSVQSVSKIEVNTLNPYTENQNSFHSDTSSSKHIVVGKTLSYDNETEEDTTPRSHKVKKKKKVKSKGMHQSFDDFPTPRSIEAAENNTDFASSLSYRIDNEESNPTEVRKLKKKAYLKKNKTGPSDEEIEMGDTLRNTGITDFTWTLGSPKKEVLSSVDVLIRYTELSRDEGPVQKNWGFAEDLEDTINTPTRRIGVRPNFEDDEDVML